MKTMTCPMCKGLGEVHAQKPLTPRQQEVLESIRGYMQQHQGVAPSLQNICDGLGWRSIATAHEIVRVLARKGWILLQPGAYRGIRLVERRD